MNPEQMLLEVEKAIGTRVNTGAKRWGLFWQEGSIRCQPIFTCKNDDNFIVVLSETDVRIGLTLKQWNKIKQRLVEILERTNQCQTAQKHSP